MIRIATGLDVDFVCFSNTLIVMRQVTLAAAAKLISQSMR
jgi:hypothetical protein